MNQKFLRRMTSWLVLALVVCALSAGVVYADQRYLIDDPAAIIYDAATYSDTKYAAPSYNLKVEEYGVSSTYPSIHTTAVLQRRMLFGSWANISSTYSFPGSIPNNFASRYGFTYETSTAGYYRIKLAQPDPNNVVVISHLLLREDF